MTISRRLARPLLSTIFVYGGQDAVRHPDGKVDQATKVLSQLSLPAEDRDLVRLNGAIQVGAGVLLATGRLPRLSALALLGSLIPTTIAGHRFWEETEPRAQAMQRIQFAKNLSLIGALLIAAFDRDGSPSLGYRARRRAAQVGDLAGDVLPG